MANVKQRRAIIIKNGKREKSWERWMQRKAQSKRKTWRKERQQPNLTFKIKKMQNNAILFFPIPHFVVSSVASAFLKWVLLRFVHRPTCSYRSLFYWWCKKKIFSENERKFASAHFPPFSASSCVIWVVCEHRFRERESSAKKEYLFPSILLS